MKAKLLIYISLFIIIGLFIISCSSPAVQKSMGPEATNTPKPVLLHPITALWEISNTTFSTSTGIPFTVLAIYLSGDNTSIIFMLPLTKTDELKSEAPQKIVDETGYSSRLLKIIPLSNDEKLTFGMLQFEPRRVGAQKLSLVSFSKKSDIVNEITFADFTGNPSEDVADRIYFDSQSGPIEQGDFLVSFRWSLLPDKQASKGTLIVPMETEVQPGKYPTLTPPIPELLTTTNVKEGALVMRNLSIEVQGKEKGVTNIYNIQMLDDGSTLVGDGDQVSIPTPIVINEVITTASSTPYP